MAMTAFIGILMPVSTLSRVSSQQDLTEILLLHTTTTNYVGCCAQVMSCTYLVSMLYVLRKYDQHIQKHYEQMDHRKTNVYGGVPQIGIPVIDLGKPCPSKKPHTAGVEGYALYLSLCGWSSQKAQWRCEKQGHTHVLLG